MTSSPPRRVLVVCTANQCRSPMGEGLIRAEAARRGISGRLVVASAGTWVVARDVPPTESAILAMAERGIDISAIRSREIDARAVEAAELILVMQESHRAAIASEFPDLGDKVQLMSALAGGGHDIADPVGGCLDDYRATAQELARLVHAGWGIIAGTSAAEGT